MNKKMDVMKKWKTLVFAFMGMGLMMACSSEDAMPEGDASIVEKEELDNGVWQSLGMSVGVSKGVKAEGDNMNAGGMGESTTRAQGELDPTTGLPTARYPEGLPVYMCRYDSENGSIAESIEVCEQNTDGTVHYYYQMRGNEVYFTTTPNDKFAGFIAVQIGEYTNGEIPSGRPNDSDLFFYASHNEVRNVYFPTLEKSWGPYEAGETCVEFGDKLFSTDGYFFQWKDAEHTRAGLYLIVRDDYLGTEIKEIKEIVNWQEADWNLSMSRMTACVSIRLMLIERFNSDGTIENIDEIGTMSTKEESVELTNKALQNYLDANAETLERAYPGVTEAMKDFNVENIFVMKKALENFPCVFDWANGLQTSNPSARKNLLMCNLDYPAWVDEMIFYQHGTSDIAALTATCDNEPFIPADSKFIQRVNLALYMGIGDQANNDHKKYGNKVIRYEIPFGEGSTTSSNVYHVTPNTHTYIYVGITLKNIVELYYHLIINPTPATRAGDEVQCITLSGNQLVTVSEPLYSSED